MKKKSIFTLTILIVLNVSFLFSDRVFADASSVKNTAGITFLEDSSQINKNDHKEIHSSEKTNNKTINNLFPKTGEKKSVFNFYMGWSIFLIFTYVAYKKRSEK
ncbi:hypothetical protein [Enterococcus faecalis]|jgi:hypothetical protein|uniref:hypothetical protein n=1 Tax=Enterococcus faecalis TaxID=1351 RepID=UPI001F57B1B2|nr:hypothetical protein [Enterococcus faecalis]